MVCVYCGGDLQVTNSRAQKRNNQVWRRRHCKQCGATFTSHEAIDTKSALMVEKGVKIEPFTSDKLFAEILLCLSDHPSPYQSARELVSTVTQNLIHEAEPSMRSTTISKVTAEVLKRFDKQAYLRYCAEHPSLQN